MQCDTAFTHAKKLHSPNGVQAMLQEEALSQANSPAGIWCVNLIDQHDIAICICPKFVFGVHQQQPPFGCFFLPKFEESQSSFAGLSSQDTSCNLHAVINDFRLLML